MTSTNGTTSDEPALSMAHVAAAKRFARMLIAAFDVCEQEALPLSPIQKIALIQVALLEFDGLEAELGSLGRAIEILQELGRQRQ
jgi:hypothetical protein